MTQSPSFGARGRFSRAAVKSTAPYRPTLHLALPRSNKGRDVRFDWIVARIVMPAVFVIAMLAIVATWLWPYL